MITKDILIKLQAYNRIALAVSGGSDSMALLHWFISNIDKTKFYVINVEHGIRGAESAQDSAFVKNYCDQHGVECKSFVVDALAYARDNKLTLEQGARDLRRDIFEREAMTCADVVATAHQRQDQAESILMHIARGTGLNGLRGMDMTCGHIIRPLIDTSKAEILAYIQENAIPYVTDSTNSDNKYARNYIRNTAFPQLEKVYPSIQDNLIKLGERAREMQDFIDSATPSVEVIEGVCSLDIASVHPLIAKEMISRAVSLLGVTHDIESRHFDLLLDLATKNNGKVDLPFGLTAYKEKDKLVITSNASVDDAEYPFGLGVFEFVGGMLIVEKSHNCLDRRALIDSDKIPRGAVIRAKRSGDKITLSYGTKSLGDFYTDNKIPSRLRGILPVIAVGGDIVAINDTAVAKAYAPDEKTNNFFKIIYIQKEKYYE